MNGSAAQLAQESFYGEKESQLLFGLRFELGSCMQERCVHSALYLEGCKMSMCLIGGSSIQTRPIRIAEGKLKVGREMPSQEHGEDGQCGDLGYSLRRSNKRLVSFFFPSIVR